MLKRLNILLFCMLASAGPAFAQGAEKALKEFEGKVLLLRHPLHGNQQRYDSAGKVLKGGVEQAWTAYGGVLIDHVTLTPNQLRIEANRMLFRFAQQRVGSWNLEIVEFKELKKHGTAPFSPSMSVDIMLDQPIDSEEQARTILSRIFALNTEDFLASVSDLWRPYLASHLTYDSSLKKEEEFVWRDPVSNPPQSAELEMIADTNGGSAEPIFHIGPEVKAPRAQVTPEPDYSEVARYEKFSGLVIVNVVVGKDGKVKRIRVVRPLGLGLEETTQSTIKDWRFGPAQRDGKPVSVEMDVTVSFNVY